MSGYMRRPYLGVLLASLAGLGGVLSSGMTSVERITQVAGAEAALLRGSVMRTGSPSPTPTAESNMAKLRDLRFYRGRANNKRRFSGVPMTVAEGKRRARKARDRARHKAHVRGRR